MTFGEHTLRYRRRPIVVEAFQYTETIAKTDNWLGVPPWALKALEKSDMLLNADGELFVKTSEGYPRVSIGDYVIHDANGEMHICKPDNFVKAYIPVNNIEFNSFVDTVADSFQKNLKAWAVDANAKR
jgi:hypothetical protein